MADIGENLRTVLVNSTAIKAEFAGIAAVGACAQNVIYEVAPTPRIWYQQQSESEEVDLDGSGGLSEAAFDIEVISDDVDEAQDIARAIKRFLNGKYGTFGTQTALGCFVEDHNDDYVPRGIGDETGYHVAAINATIMYATT